MPFVSNMPDNEEDKTNQSTGGQGPVSPTGSGGAVHLAPSSAVATVGGGGTSGSGPAAAGGSFASLDKYLTANQGQAAPLTGKITAGITNQYNDLDTANNAAISNLNTQVTNAPGYTPSNPDVMAQEAANPVSFAGDQGNVKNFQSLLTNSYGGPLSAEATPEYTTQQNAINSAIAAGKNNTTTEAGRQNLLVQNEATPTTGVTALNSAILSQDPNALNSVETAYQPFNNLLGNLSTGAAGVNANIGREQADATASAKAANDAIASQIGSFNTGVTGALTNTQKNLTDQNTRIKADVASGNVTPEDIKAMGMTPEQWSSLSAAQKAAATPHDVSSNQGQYGASSGTANIDLTNFLNQTDPNALLNASNTATPEDYAKAQAFQTLLNGLNLNAPSTIINSSTANQAGTAPTNFNTFDYQTAMNTAQQAQTSEIAAAQAYVDALQAGADEEHAQLAAQDVAKKNTAAAATSMLGLPTAALSALGVGGDVGKYATQYTQAIGAPMRKAETAAGTAVGDVVNGRGTNTAGGTAKNVAEQAAINTVGLGIPQAVNAIVNVFCFHPDTLVTMADGSQMPICRIGVGDLTKGGKVLATTRAVAQDFYWYNGVIVTGKHAVKESGEWVRVENSKLGHRFAYLTEIVCNLVTENHRIYANGIEFADQHETDMYESLDMNESLQELNNHAKHVG